jgi:hypothetical protein
MKITRYCLVPVLLILTLQVRAHAQAVQSPPPGTVVMGPTNETTRPATTGFVDLLLGAAYTDNALLTSGASTRDELGEAGFDVDYARKGNLNLALLGNVVRLDYLHHTIPGSFYGHFFGSMIFGKSTDPLQWQTQEAFGEVTPDPLAAPIPQNLETINDVSTGPLVNMHFGLTNRLTLDGIYSRTSYQRSPYDSQTYGGGLKFSHALSGAAALSFEANDAKTQYLEGSALRKLSGVSVPPYTIALASLSYSGKFVRTVVVLRGGYNTIAYQPGPTHGAPLYELDITRRVSPFSTVFVSVESEYSTNGTSLGTPQTQIGLQSGASLNAAYSVAEPYNQRSGTLGWTFHRARTQFSLMARVMQVLFDQSLPANSARALGQQNYLDEGGDVMISRRLRPTVSVELRGSADFERYSNLDARTHRESVQLMVSKQFRRAAIWVYVERLSQSGSRGVSTFQAASYSEDVVGVSFTFDLFGHRAPGSPIRGGPSLMGLTGGY